MTFIRPILAALLLAGLAFAQQTPAGTEAGTKIENQASAAYVDSAGRPQTTNSNLVVTTVQQVYDVSITPDGTVAAPGQFQDATPGSTVYFPYTLTNTGNGADTFDLTSIIDGSSNVTVSTPIFYLENNGDGTGDGVVQPGEAVVTSVDNLEPGASVKLIMAYDIPTTVDTANAPTDIVVATPVGTSQGDNTVVDDANYHQTTVVQNAVIRATKSVSQTTADPGDSLTYIVTLTNTGSADATNVEVTDTLPAGVTYVASSAVTTPAANGTSITVDDTGAPTITATFATITPGQIVELEIQATVNANTTPGDLENVASVTYDELSDPTDPVETNTTTTTVSSTVGVAVGPNGEPDAAAAVDYNTSEGYNVTSSAGTLDTQVVASANTGTSVSFINTVENDGTATDTFNLSTDTTGLNLPAGANVQLFTLSGAPLGDSNGDGVPDSGPLGVGASQSFITRVFVPADTPSDEDGGTTLHSVVVTATSATDGTSDTTTNTITDIAGAGVSFGNDDPDNTADDADDTVDDPNGVAVTTGPDTIVVFPMDIVNDGSSSDTFNLSGSVPFAGGTVPVVYYSTNPDADGDGTVTPAELAALTPISNTGAVDPNEEITVFAVVQVPDDATPQTNVTVNQSVSSPTSGAGATFNVNTITVTPLDTFTFSPDRSGNVTSPGTVIYSHTLTNTSNEAITGFTFTDASSGLGTEGFTYTYSYDGVTFYDLGDAALALPSNLASGDAQDFFVRVSAPDGVVIGAQNTLTVTAEATFAGAGTAQQSVTDTTVVVGGELSLVKSVDNTEAEPGDTLVYTVTGTNLGTDDLTDVVVSDPLPAYTDFVSVSATLGGYPAGGSEQVLYSVDGATYGAAAPTSLAAGASVYVGVDSDGDGDVDTDDTLPAGAEVVVTFTVTVQ